jgi:uncharacterized membrane protein
MDKTDKFFLTIISGGLAVPVIVLVYKIFIEDNSGTWGGFMNLLYTVFSTVLLGLSLFIVGGLCWLSYRVGRNARVDNDIEDIS